MVETRVPLLDHGQYVAADAYAAEIGRVFRRQWLYLGLAGAVPDQVTTAGLPIAIRGDAATCGGQPVELDRCGSFVFGRLTPGGPSLAATLAPFVPDLERISAHLVGADHHARWAVAANWKLLAENTLDDAHAAALHRDTLYRSLSPDWLARQRFDRHGPNGAMANDLAPADLAFWEKLARRLPLARHGSGTGYRHLFFFPNFYVATFFDALVVIHRIEPMGPASSALEVSTCLPSGSAGNAALHRAVIADITAKAAAVVAEDLVICAQAQRGRHFAVHPGLLGSRELRIADFQEAVLG